MNVNITTCRSCGCRKPPTKLKDMLLYHHDKQQVSELYHELLGIEILPHDPISRSICQKCERLLFKLHQFRKQARFMDHQLRTVKVFVKTEDDPNELICSDEGDMDVEGGHQSEPEIPVPVKLEVDDDSKMEEVKPEKPAKVEGPVQFFQTSNMYKKLEKELKARFRKNKDGIFDCEQCTMSFRRAIPLADHMEECHNETGVFKCAICHREFLEFAELRKHREEHIYKPFECFHCGSRYRGLSTLRGHINVVHNPDFKRPARKLIGCLQCGKTYANASKLRRHEMAAHEGGLPKVYSCRLCDKKMASRCSLQAHMRNQHGMGAEKPRYECEKCGKTYANVSLFKEHVQRHIADVRPYFCDQCGASFRTKSILNQHFIRHQKERPYICPRCASSFRNKYYYNRHIRMHEEDDAGFRIECPVCKKLLKSKESYGTHKRLHDSVDTWKKCSHCEKRYVSTDNLNRHIRRVHGGVKDRVECTICLKTLWSKKDILAHIDRDHAVVLEQTGKLAVDYTRKLRICDNVEVAM